MKYNLDASRCVVLLVSMLSVAYPGFVRAQDHQDPLRFHFAAIDVPGAVRTLALGTNNRGDIVGGYDLPTETRAFLLRDGVYMTFAMPNAVFTSARGINDRGDIVGTFVDASFTGHGFLWRKGTFTVVDFPGALSSDAFAINNSGVIVGDYFVDPGLLYARGFLLDDDGFKQIDVGGSVESPALGISAQGEVVGLWDSDLSTFHGFTGRKGRFETVDFPGAVASWINGISAHGELVGDYFDSMGSHGYVSDGEDFVPFEVPGSVPGQTLAVGVNDARQVVGFYKDVKAGHLRGFLATPVRHD